MWSDVISNRMPREGGYTMADSGSFDDDDINCDLADGWYENDLHLAAELGKTLLERNKELDENLLTAQQENDEQAMQIVYLEKQLQILRDVTESKAHIYEQLDLSNQETDKSNQRLQHELRTAHQRILRMSETCESLEAKVGDQQTQIQTLKAAERERLREGRRQQKILEAFGTTGQPYPLRRSRSHDYGVGNVESALDEELMSLHQSVKSIHEKLTAKEQQIAEMEAEMSVLLKENGTLEERARETEVRSRLEDIRRDYKSLDGDANEAVCKYCDGLINADFEAVVREGETTPAAATAASQDLGMISEETGSFAGKIVGHPKMEGLSLVGEIDAQYNVLMEKYNSLLTRSRCGSFRDENLRPRALSIRQKKMEAGIAAAPAKGQPTASPMEYMFESSPPEYKKLFNEIFEILHRPQLAQRNQAKSEETAIDGES